eukprot:g3145.t1
MKRSSSIQQLVTMMGPSQLKSLENRPDAIGRRFFASLTFLIGMIVLGTLVLVCFPGFQVEIQDIPGIVYDVATLRRFPITSQDNAANIVATVLCLFPIYVFDWSVCRTLCPNSGARWYLIHAMGNVVICLMSVQDFYWISKNPPASLSVAYCKSLPSPACSDWPPCLTLALHLYHMVAFDLNENDIFHHVLFVPIIGGIRFTYPWGCAGNVLCFFICGLPGAIDYFMLAAVKSGKLKKMVEKRINCSINTWLRGPGITAFCTLVGLCWLKPYPGTPESDVMPTWVILSCGGVVFFNGQHYAQRVIGDYYIKKREDYSRRGIKRVDLHAS